MAARRQPNPNSESVDNYLKAILLLGGPEENRVTSNALARRLSVAPASVTNTCESWQQARLRWSNMSGIAVFCLSSAGRKRAVEVVRHHRLIETFLYEVLDYPIDEVHEEAERSRTFHLRAI